MKNSVQRPRAICLSRASSLRQESAALTALSSLALLLGLLLALIRLIGES